MAESFGGRSISFDSLGAVKPNVLKNIASSTPAVLWIALGTNEYTTVSTTTFRTDYAGMLDSLRALLPNTKFICQTPILRSSEGLNAFGATLEDYRKQINDVCGSRNWTRVFDGKTITTTEDLNDGLHPSTLGHQKYASKIYPVLAPLVSTNPLSISGPNTTVVSATSTLFTISLNTDSSFVGNEVITLSDSSNTGLLSSSFATTSASSTLSLVPTASSTSLTFTYTPLTIGQKILTVANSQMWNNPGDVVLTSTNVPVVEEIQPTVIYWSPGSSGGGIPFSLLKKDFTDVLINEKNTPKINYSRFFGLGDTGVDVVNLQKHLILKKYFTYKTATGYFGPITKTALIKFQKDNNILPSTGYFGPKTKAKLME
jgi:hypothetical protein